MTATASKRPLANVPAAELHTTYGAFSSALAALAIGTVGKSTLPILTGFLLDWNEPGGPVLSTFNFDSACRIGLKPEFASGSGQAVVGHAEMVKLLKAMVKGLRRNQHTTLPVKLALSTGGALSVEVNDIVMPLNTMPAADFPALPVTSRAVAVLDRDDLAALVKRVGVAASTDKTLPMLTGVHVSTTQGRIRLACCDRFRIACGTLLPRAELQQDIDAVVPLSLLTAAAKHLPAGDIALYFDTTPATRLALTTAPGAPGPMIEVSAALLDANYPPVERERERFASDTGGTVVELDRETALRAVRQADAVLKAKGGGQVRLEAGADDGVLIRPDIDVSCTIPTIPARYAATTTFPAALFNGAFLGDALAAFTGSTVALRISSGMRPLLLVDDVASLAEPLRSWHLLMPAKSDT